MISGNDSKRPHSADMLQHKLTRNCPKNIQPRPKSSPMHMFRVDTEIPKHECIDVTKQDEDHWKYIADQEALLTLEKELQSYASKWKYCFFFFFPFMLVMKTSSYLFCYY